MNAHSLPNHATLSVRILKEATSVHVPVATFSRKMERPVEVSNWHGVGVNFIVYLLLLSESPNLTSDLLPALCCQCKEHLWVLVLELAQYVPMLGQHQLQCLPGSSWRLGATIWQALSYTYQQHIQPRVCIGLTHSSQHLLTPSWQPPCLANTLPTPPCLASLPFLSAGGLKAWPQQPQSSASGLYLLPKFTRRHP